MIESWEQFFWSFLRGELTTEEFEASIYASPELEGILGADDYLTVISYDYRTRRDYHDFLYELQNIVRRRFPRTCECMSVGQRGTMSLGSIEAPIERTEVLFRANPWLDLRHCPDCSTFWYVATDTVDDLFYLYRMSRKEVEAVAERGVFPDVFDERSFGWPSPGSFPLDGCASVEDWRTTKNTPEMLGRLRALISEWGATDTAAGQRSEDPDP